MSSKKVWEQNLNFISRTQRFSRLSTGRREEAAHARRTKLAEFASLGVRLKHLQQGVRRTGYWQLIAVSFPDPPSQVLLSGPPSIPSEPNVEYECAAIYSARQDRSAAREPGSGTQLIFMVVLSAVARR